MDKETLFKVELPQRDVEIPDVGTVRVRGLTRKEALIVVEKPSTADKETWALAFAMVDPKLTREEVEKWQASATPGQIEVVTNAILGLSGMLEEAEKEAVQRFPEPLES